MRLVGEDEREAERKDLLLVMYYMLVLGNCEVTDVLRSTGMGKLLFCLLVMEAILTQYRSYWRPGLTSKPRIR